MKTLNSNPLGPMRLLLACFVTLTTSFAWAAGGAAGDGGGAGNTGGGTGILCYRNNRIIKRESYDFYKGRSNLYNFVIPSSSLPYMQQVQGRINRVRRFDVHLAEQMQELLSAFAPEAIASGNGNVILVDRLEREGDEALDISPGEDYLNSHGCDRVEVSRIASFFPFDFPGQARFHLVQKFWTTLDEESKAAIVQHEMIYSLAKHYFKNPTSTQAQYFNALISSTKFDAMDPYAYYLELRSLRWFVDYQKHYDDYPKTYEGIVGISMSSIHFMGADFLMEDGLISDNDGKGNASFEGFVLPNPPAVQFQEQAITPDDKQTLKLDSNGGFMMVNKTAFSLRLPGYVLSFLPIDLKAKEDHRRFYVDSYWAGGVIDESEVPFKGGTIHLPRETEISNVNVKSGEMNEIKIPDDSIAVFNLGGDQFPLANSAAKNDKIDVSVSEGKIQTAYLEFCDIWRGRQLILNKKVIKPDVGSSKLDGFYYLTGNGYLRRVASCRQGGVK